MGSVNRFGQKTGRETGNWCRRDKPESIELNGLWCQVRPLRPDDAETLFHEWQSIDDDRDWTYLSHNKPQSIIQCIDYFNKLSECKQSIHLAVTDKKDNLVKGIFSVGNIDCDNGVFELTDVNWTPQMKRTRASTESIFLVLSLFFNKLGYRRCEWRTNIYNEEAIRSANRLGFRHEGILRDKKSQKVFPKIFPFFL